MSESAPKPLTRDLAPFGLRIPPDLKERIRTAAEANNRSMNAEIVARLSATLEDPSFETLPDTLSDLLSRVERLERMVEDHDQAMNPLRYERD